MATERFGNVVVDYSGLDAKMIPAARAVLSRIYNDQAMAGWIDPADTYTVRFAPLTEGRTPASNR